MNGNKFSDLIQEVANKYGVSLTTDVAQGNDGRWWLLLRPGECFLRDVEALRKSDDFEIIGLEWSNADEAWYHERLVVDPEVYDIEDEGDALDWFVFDGGIDTLVDANSMKEAIVAFEFSVRNPDFY